MEDNTTQATEVFQDTQPFVPEQFVVSLQKANETATPQKTDVLRAKDTPLWKKLAGRYTPQMYQLLDRTVGKTSYALTSEGDTKYTPAAEIIEMLQAHNYILNYNFQFRRYNDAPAFTRFNIMHQYPEGVTDGYKLKKSFANGLDKDPAVAISQGVGEFLERYFLTLYKKDALVKASAESLTQKQRPHLDLSQLAGYSKEQKQNEKRLDHTTESVFFWEEMIEYSTNKKVLLPAQLVYWNYELNPDEALLKEVTTNGAAGMTDYRSAVLGGLYELIQRDAFMIFWHNHMTPPQIDPDTIKDRQFQALLREAREHNFTVYCLNFTTDLRIPVTGVLIEDNKAHFPKRVLGLGASGSFLKSMLRAFTEAWSIYYWMRSQGPIAKTPNIEEPFTDRTISQRERTQFLGMPDLMHHYDFLTEGTVQTVEEAKKQTCNKEHASVQAELDAVVANLESRGEEYRVYVYQAEHSILKTIGFYSVQTVVPALIPIHMHEHRAHLGGTRLKTVPQELGYKVADAWNPVPQPFP